MRFDFVPFYSPGEPKPWHKVVQQMREEAMLADEAGFQASRRRE